jgi:hypothetical protein
MAAPMFLRIKRSIGEGLKRGSGKTRK